MRLNVYGHDDKLPHNHTHDVEVSQRFSLLDTLSWQGRYSAVGADDNESPEALQSRGFLSISDRIVPERECRLNIDCSLFLV